MRVLVIGAGGMLGSAMLQVLAESESLELLGSARSGSVRKYLPKHLAARLILGVDVLHQDSLLKLMREVRPDVVVNCIGLVKQLSEVNDPLQVLPINAMLPHRLAELCGLAGARLVHISTDCVFSGDKGGYSETDCSDANDLYGRSKFLGEVAYPHTVTLRTSIIGHELSTAHGLVDWFLSQSGSVRGYTKAVFSGLPTVELARLVRDYVLGNMSLSGLFHVAASPISKYDLLGLVALEYGLSTTIVPCEEVRIDRSLDATRFQQATGYVAPEWPVLVASMHRQYLGKYHDAGTQ